ncbi:hypothetical protein [Nocardia brasiliensis]|uniref:hypothetical protein n=1 Tax=Nocardia brasiliensis TaxID=37326 RepID=UPI0004A70E9C|nr:hypothetical protein [Nocardia brasiliensis]
MNELIEVSGFRLSGAETARILEAVSAFARAHPLGPARYARLAMLALQNARLNPWQVPDDPLDEWPVVPTAYFGAPERGPATATAERCALAAEHPSLAPPLGLLEAALFDLAVENAFRRPRVRLWGDDRLRNAFMVVGSRAHINDPYTVLKVTGVT